MLKLITFAGGNGCGVQWLTQKQRGCKEEEDRTLRLAITDALLEGHTSEGCKEWSHGPHCFLMGGYVLRQWLWLQAWSIAVIAGPESPSSALLAEPI